MEDDNEDRDDTKRRCRNLSEKKRRDQFNSLVNDLSALISTSNRKMDKSTVLKSTIAFLKHHNEVTDRSKVFEIQQDWKPSFLSNDEFTQLMLESLNGFIIVFNAHGSILYTSESITAQLGYLPYDLLKMNIFDLAYELDHESLFNILVDTKPKAQPPPTDVNSAKNQITFYLHLKRGGCEAAEFNSYELVKFVGYFRINANVESAGMPNTQLINLPRILKMNPNAEIDKKLIFVGTGCLQMPQLIQEITVIDPTGNEFTSKHSMEWKFLYLDQRAPPIIGYMPFEVLGTSGYDYYHFDDLDNIVNCHEELMQTGKVKSGFYRFLTKGQQWIWLQTDFYISYNQYNAKPEYVHCTHKVINYTDILKHFKKERKNQTIISLKSLNATAQDGGSNNVIAEHGVTNNMSGGGGNLGNSLNSGILSNETSPSLESSTIWTNQSTPTGIETSGTSCQLNASKISRPASSYGNISPTGVSPNVKRKRCFYNNRGGNESDSTSMSADSTASRQSLMTHLSSNRQRHIPVSGVHNAKCNNISSNVQTLNSQISSSHHHQYQHCHNNVQAPQAQLHCNQHVSSHAVSHIHTPTMSQQHSMPVNVTAAGQQKLMPILAQHAIPTSTSIMANSIQFSQPAFPLRSSQLVGTTAAAFLEPSQYITAIPVQSVITPCPVAPILSPMRNQAEMISGTVVMTPTQTQLQEQLQRKHDELQKLIMQQQDELRIVSQQLLLARYTLLQPMVPMNFTSTTIANTPLAIPGQNNTRNYSFSNSNNSGMNSQQVNQYAFSLNAEQVQNHQDQQHQFVMQHQAQHLPPPQQQQQQQQQQLVPSYHQHHYNHNHHHHIAQANASNTVALQHQSPTVQSPMNTIQQQLSHQDTNHHIQQQQQSLSTRSVSELDQFAQEEFDAFLNLSPLQSLDDSQTGLNQMDTAANPTSNNVITRRTATQPNTVTTDNNGVNVANLTVNSATTERFPQNNNNNASSSNRITTNTNEDSLLSYMQIETNPTLNFSMVNCDTAKDNSTLADHLNIEPPTTSTSIAATNRQLTAQSGQSGRDSPTQRSQYFPSDSFLSLNNSSTSSNMANANENSTSTGVSNHLPNDLEMLPFQMSQEQSQNLFNTSSHAAGSSQ